MRKDPVSAGVRLRSVHMSKQESRPNAVEALAAVTDKDEDEFTPDLEAYPYPEPEDLEEVPADEVSNG